jgi:hypothetical protein
VVARDSPWLEKDAITIMIDSKGREIAYDDVTTFWPLTEGIEIS